MNIVYWNSNNLGDLFNIYIGLMYNYKHIAPITHGKKQNKSIFFVGSILTLCGDNNIIVGSGLKHNLDKIEIKNNKIYCLRGKLTKKAIGINSDILLCDPGLIVRKLHIPKNINNTKKVLIIPHYNHKHLFPKNTNQYDVFDIQFNLNNYKFIVESNYESIENKNKIIELFNHKFNIINSYDLILSSSLHGLVFSHAFGKKTIYFQIKEEHNEPVHKYNDYYSIYNMTVSPVIIKTSDIPDIKYNNYINNTSHNVDISKYEKIIKDLDSSISKVLNLS